MYVHELAFYISYTNVLLDSLEYSTSTSLYFEDNTAASSCESNTSDGVLEPSIQTLGTIYGA